MKFTIYNSLRDAPAPFGEIAKNTAAGLGGYLATPDGMRGVSLWVSDKLAEFWVVRSLGPGANSEFANYIEGLSRLQKLLLSLGLKEKNSQSEDFLFVKPGVQVSFLPQHPWLLKVVVRTPR